MSLIAGYHVESGNFIPQLRNKADQLPRGGSTDTGERSNYFLAPGYAFVGISEKNIGLLGCFSLKLLIAQSGGKHCVGRLQSDSALSFKPKVTSLMQLLSGEAAAQLAKQYTITGSSSSFVGKAAAIQFALCTQF